MMTRLQSGHDILSTSAATAPAISQLQEIQNAAWLGAQSLKEGLALRRCWIAAEEQATWCTHQDMEPLQSDAGHTVSERSHKHPCPALGAQSEQHPLTKSCISCSWQAVIAQCLVEQGDAVNCTVSTPVAGSPRTRDSCCGLRKISGLVAGVRSATCARARAGRGLQLRASLKTHSIAR